MLALLFFGVTVRNFGTTAVAAVCKPIFGETSPGVGIPIAPTSRDLMGDMLDEGGSLVTGMVGNAVLHPVVFSFVLGEPRLGLWIRDELMSVSLEGPTLCLLDGVGL